MLYLRDAIIFTDKYGGGRLVKGSQVRKAKHGNERGGYTGVNGRQTETRHKQLNTFSEMQRSTIITPAAGCAAGALLLLPACSAAAHV